MLEIKAGHHRVGIYPALGGAVGYWLCQDIPIFYPLINSHLAQNANQIIAAYPLIPYSNRIADGKFEFEGRHYQLDANALNGNDAIHGNAWEREWELDSFSKNSVLLSLDHDPTKNSKQQWPFAYKAQLKYTISVAGLSVRISFQNTDRCNQPVGLGFHPYFPRNGFVELGFTAKTVWNNGSNGLPEGRMSIDGRWAFDHMRALSKEEQLDNCYAGWDNFAFIRWKHLNAYLTMTSSPIFQHLVLFNPENQPYFTLEPATNMNNALNMPEISDRGLMILKPGQTVQGDILYSFSGS
ncbi:aldose 1-epimerase [Commensalibacter nepenthis]|uniref:Aldose 1-epimerase n=1 Tax=Commensalibacter nepenthis TaxID=3043872 RepID=A0ABT6Q9P9_9PROT|nr:aldose 1-epimerase [Commensalibacter sp. TBRC 10068]MDI2113627.1 aldose 1-epimerase [Commensalibacter sp. TBRC 10068]